MAWLTLCSVAGSEVGFGLSPMRVELAMSPGQTQTFDVLLSNPGKSQTTRFRVLVLDVQQDRSGGYTVVESGHPGYSCAKWIRPSVREVALQPGQAAGVKFSITAPRDAFGGRYAAVVFELVSDREIEAKAFVRTEFVYRLATIVEVTVSGSRVRRALSVTGFEAGPTSAYPRYASYGSGGAVLAAQVNNDGNTHLFAQGTLTLRDALGKFLRRIPLGAGRGLVMPESTVELVSVLPSGLAAGDYMADISVAYGGFRPASARIPFSVTGHAIGSQPVTTSVRLAPVTVEPAILELSYPAGATGTGSVVMTNRSDESVRVVGAAMPLAYDDEGELVLTDEAPDGSSCAGWIQLRPDAVTIAPRGKAIVRLLVSIPKGESGCKYANVVFTASPLGSADGESAPAGDKRSANSSQWSEQAGSAVYLSVGKKLEKAGSLTGIDIEDIGASVGRVFSAKFTNMGTIHVTPKASFTIGKKVIPQLSAGVEYTGRGSYVDLDTLLPGEVDNVVLPGANRLFRVSYARPLEPGEYLVEVSVNYGGQAPLYASEVFRVE